MSSLEIEVVKTKFIVLKGDDTRHLKSFLSGLDGAIWDFKNKQWIIPYEHKKVLRKEMKKPIEEIKAASEKMEENQKEQKQITIYETKGGKVVIEGPTFRMRKYLFAKGGKFNKETKMWEFEGKLDEVVKNLNLKGKNVVVKK